MSAVPASSLAAVERAFEENFRSRAELGAAVSIWQHGREILALDAGFTNRERTQPWTRETLVPVWSATKGPAALACLYAWIEARLEADVPVSDAWLEFVGGGKAEITFSQLMSHTAGLYGLTERVPIFDFDAVILALEHQQPLHEPGTQQGYHARTFGFLLDEIVRRLSGLESLGEFFHEVFGSPMEVDFWIGLPQRAWPRVATLYPGKFSLEAQDPQFQRALATPGSPTALAFSTPVGLHAVADMNQSETWQRGYPAMGGVGSASGLGKIYAMLANGGCWQGEQVVSEKVLSLLEGVVSSSADDLVLRLPCDFSLGMMKDPIDPETGGKVRQLFGPSKRAYGHPGAGGSLAFADPENGISFAYVMNQMELGILPGKKALSLVEALYSHL
jgi:CubicO group peptidase (beta-lactamase class C family)